MDDKLRNKSNIGVIIIIVLLSLLVIMLGYYFVSHEFLNNNIVEETEKNDTNNANNTISQEANSEEHEIEYKFDADKIVNKDTRYIYSLDVTNEYANVIPYEKTADGYKFCSGNYCEELKGDFTTIVGAIIFKGGPGIDAGYDFLVSKTGDLYYVNKVDIEKLEIAVIPQIKDVVKLYVANLINDNEVSRYGSTVIAQTKDGLLYDVYSYVNQY